MAQTWWVGGAAWATFVCLVFLVISGEILLLEFSARVYFISFGGPSSHMAQTRAQVAIQPTLCLMFFNFFVFVFVFVFVFLASFHDMISLHEFLGFFQTFPL